MYDAGKPIDEIYEYYAGFMKIVSPMTFHHVMNPSIDRKLAIEEVIEGGIQAEVTPALGPMMVEILTELTEKYPPCRGYLELTSNDGRKVKTLDKGEIGTLYIMILERTGDSLTAVGSGKRQTHGLPVKVSRGEKNSFPIKISSTRFPSEADTKSVQSHLNNAAIPELVDRNLNPISHRILCRELVRTEEPHNIKDAVPRTKFPRKGNRVSSFRDNMLFTGGLRVKDGLDGNLVLPGDDGYNGES